MGRRCIVLGLLFAGLALSGRADPVPAEVDEQLLKSAGLASDGPALVAYFRQRTVGEEDRARILALIKQLGDHRYAIRERATMDLIAVGLPAVGLLRQSSNDADVEIARRAERCLKAIERVPSTALSAAAARLLARAKPAAAAEVLLAYLPLADDESVADEVREALAALAGRDDRPEPLLVKALDDPLPLRRGAAGEALVKCRRADATQLARKLMTDPDPEVRVRVTLAVVTHAKDKTAVPAVIGLLADVPQNLGWRVEEVMVRLAGETAPAVSLGTDDEGRKRCRDAWSKWWADHAGTTDLAKLDSAPRLLGFTLVVMMDQRGIAGKVMEINANREVVWKIEGLTHPRDAIVIGKDRVLIAEQNGSQISERDFAGVVKWNKQVVQPMAVQPLPNGHVFVANRNQLLEFDEKHREAWKFDRQQHDIVTAQKLRNGETMFLTNTGALIRLDANRKEIKSVKVDRPHYVYAAMEVLPNNRVLLTHQDRVAEYDFDGKQQWYASVRQPSSVQRLPNGNTLIANVSSRAVQEIDRQGKVVWEYKPEGAGLPWSARRR